MSLKPTLVCLALLWCSTALAQKGIGTNTPNSSAALHVDSPNKGVLIPSLNLTNSSTFSPITGTSSSSHNGLLVWNHNTTTNNGLAGTGYYFWQNTTTPGVGNWYKLNSTEDGALPASGTVTHSTLRWDGEGWVENTGLQSDGTTTSSMTTALRVANNVTVTGTVHAFRNFRAGENNIGNPNHLGFVGNSNTYFVLSNTAVPAGVSNYFNNFNGNTALLLRRLAGGSGKFLVGQNNGGVTQFEIGRYGGAYFGDDVGIGTTTPAHTLQVSGTAQVTGALHDSSGDAGTAGQVLSTTGTQTNWISLSPSSLTDEDGDTLIQLEEGGDDDDTIRFDTNGAERLTIEPTGEVLLADPGAFLAPGFSGSAVLGVASATNVHHGRLRITAGSTDTFNDSQGASIDLHGNNATANTGTLDLVAGSAASGSNNALRVFTNNGAGQQTSLVVAGNGNTGIGTTAPAHTLQVSGTAQVTGALHDSSGDAGTAGQVLSTTGTQTNWVDNFAPGSGTTTNSTLRWDGSDWVEATTLLSSPTDVSISVTTTINEHFESSGGGKYVVQGGHNGGANRGIRMWRGNSSDWGIYMASGETGKNLAGTTTPTQGYKVEGYALRFRAASTHDYTPGVIFENNYDQLMASINTRLGDAYFKGPFTIGSFTPTGTFSVNGSGHFSTTFLDSSGDAGTAGQVLSSTGTQTNWIDNNVGKLIDADGDTQVQVEESSNDDTIRFDTAGDERMSLNPIGQLIMNGARTTTTVPTGAAAVILGSGGFETLAAGNISLYNMTNSFGAPSTLFNTTLETGGATFHGNRSSAGIDWGYGYSFTTAYQMTSIRIHSRVDCCDLAGGGEFRLYRNGTLVASSTTVAAPGVNAWTTAYTPNIIADEVRYIFPNGANVAGGGGQTSAAEFEIIGREVSSTTSYGTTLNLLKGDIVVQEGVVGIGTTTPAHTLQVSGTAQISGALHDSSGDAGTAGQVLSSTGTQTNWVDNSPIASGTVANSTLRWDGSDWVEATALLSSPNDVSISVSSTLATTTLTNVLQDYDGEPGTSGQVLSSTGTGTQWMSVGDLPAGDYLTASRGFRAGPNIGNPSRLGFLGGSNTYFILSNNTVPGGTSNYFNNFNNNTAVVMRRLAGGGGKFIVAQNNLGVTQFEVGRYGSAYFGDNVGIGDATPTEGTLVVNGSIVASGSITASQTLTPDYVFEQYFTGTSESNPSYRFPSLSEVEAFVKENHHLPNVLSAGEVKQQGGIVLNRASEVQLEKIEELYLHAIAQKKRIDQQQQQLEKQAATIAAQQQQMNELYALLKQFLAEEK